MKILNRLPYYTEHTTVTVGGELVRVKPFQIIVWVSVSLASLLEWDPRTPGLPAILDTGTNHNFSIYQSQLIRWAGIRPELLRVLRPIRVGGKRVALHAAALWLHPNFPGSRERQAGRKPFRLDLDQGIAIHPDEGPATPHLPLLGLRALTDNRLHTTIDGQHREVSLGTRNRLAEMFRTLRLPPF